MINKILQSFDERYKESVFSAYPEYQESHNILLSDIKSFIISAFIEDIDNEIKWAESQMAKLNNCNDVSGVNQSECYKQYNRALDWNEVIRRFISHLEAKKKELLELSK